MTSRTYPEYPQVAVGAVVIHKQCVLLVQRGRAPAKGLWSIPGGRVRLGESLQQAAEREILEETGLQIKADKPLEVVEVIDRDDQGRVRFHYVIVDLWATYLQGDLQSGSDALAACWVSRPALETLNVNPATRKLLHEKCRFGDLPVSTRGGAHE